MRRKANPISDSLRCNQPNTTTMNTQTSTLISQLTAASQHAARIAEDQELTTRQREIRMAEVREAREKAKSESSANTMEAVLLARLPVGKKNAINYPGIRKLLEAEAIHNSSVSSMLCVLVKKGQVKRTGQLRSYRYYKESTE